jgi:hypothetical protein
MLLNDIMIEITYDSFILMGILISGLFWIVRTVRKDKEDKKNSNRTKVSNI